MPYFPPHIQEHADSCVVCQEKNFEPLCEDGSKMLADWIIGALNNLWEQAGQEPEQMSFAA